MPLDAKEGGRRARLSSFRSNWIWRKAGKRVEGREARTRSRCSIGLELLRLGAFVGFRSTAIFASIGTNPPWLLMCTD
jgi:hypothetical protein